MKEEASMDQAFLEKVHKAIENNLANENFGVEELALEIGISRIHLHRKLKILTRQSASHIIKEFRLKKAMEMLQNNVATSSEISYQVGFGSPSYFNTCFREHFGYPPGKVKRTKSVKTKRKHTITVRYLFASIAIFVFGALIILNILPRTNKKENPDKAIAVLPFRSLSDDPEKQYLADGVMYEILTHLSKIGELRVLPWISVEQYRTTDKTATEICQELGVKYLLTGRFSKYGDQARLNVQLIQSGKEDHVWAGEYDREWKDILAVESEVAKIIAGELNAAISPEEKELIEKIPTTNLTAYDFYQRGREEHILYKLDNDNRVALERAEELYHDALEYDPTFAKAYSELGRVYLDKHFWETYFSDNFLDSVFILTDIALSYDDQLAEAYTVRGDYYSQKGFREQAIREYDKAIKFNPNDWLAYRGRGLMYWGEDLVKTLADFHKAAFLIHGSELPILLRIIGSAYINAGFIEKCNNYIEDALKLDGDSARYYNNLARGEWFRGNYAKSIEIGKKAYAIDSTDRYILSLLGRNYLYLGQFEESLKYYKKYIERLEELGNLDLNDMVEIGYVYSKNGYKEEADYYLDKQLIYCNKSIELGRLHAKDLYSYYNLAAVYAFRGDKDKAYENLRIFNKRPRMSIWILKIKIDPLFESIWAEPEFQQIVESVEEKYQAEHERIKQWLEENEML